jgi:hypothetical protein
MNLEELNMILARGGNSCSENKQEIKQLALFPQFAEIEDPELFLFQKGSSWMGKGVKLRNLRMNKINNIQFGDFQKGSSWEEKGGKPCGE